MKSLASFLALSGSDRRLLMQAILMLMLVRGALHVAPIARLRDWTGRMRAGNRPASRIIWAVRTATRRVPGATCLSSALALQRILSSNGHRSQIHIGVARVSSAFVAHAWLVHDGAVVIGEEEHERYTRLTAWEAGQRFGPAG